MSDFLCSGDLIFGNKKNGVGLCVLWSPKKAYTEQIDNVQIIGNLYSAHGISIMIKNVLSHPDINTIIVTGIDNPEPSRQNGEVIINKQYEKISIEKRYIDEFYSRIRIIDARHIKQTNQKELSIFISLIPIINNSYNPIYIENEIETLDSYPTNRSGHIIRSDSIKSAHIDIINEIKTFGELTFPDSEGHKRQELWQVTTCLSQQCSYRDIPFYDDDEIIRYGESLWNGDEPEGLTYRYGHTLRYKYGDQVQAVINAFKRKPETFRTVMTLWEPLQSLLRDDEPCLITIHPPD